MSSQSNSGPLFYAWFIKRDGQWRRTHRIHMKVEGIGRRCLARSKQH